jgi:AcrR family transcriptional regulator
MTPEPQEKTETRELILEAARQRFKQFGYTKTTMAEIAGDCSMSAANLYRFFENKQDIGAALACQCLADDEARLKAALKHPGMSAAQRFEAFVLETLHYTYEQWQEQPRMGELVQDVISTRSDLVQQHQQVKTRLLAELLRAGNDSGEFDVHDPEHVAGTILVAIIALDVPFFLGMYSKDRLEAIGRDVAALILKGLLKR